MGTDLYRTRYTRKLCCYDFVRLDDSSSGGSRFQKQGLILASALECLDRRLEATVIRYLKTWPSRTVNARFPQRAVPGRQSTVLELAPAQAAEAVPIENVAVADCQRAVPGRQSTASTSPRFLRSTRPSSWNSRPPRPPRPCPSKNSGCRRLLAFTPFRPAALSRMPRRPGRASCHR